MIIRAKYWLGTNIDYNLTSISSSFLSSFPSSFANLRAFQSQNDFWPGRALRRWIDSETNTDWLTNGVRLSRSSIDVVIQSIRWWLCSGRGDGFVEDGIDRSVAAVTAELADGYT